VNCKILLLLTVLFSFQSQANYTYGEIFYIKEASKSFSKTAIYLGSNTDNNLLDSKHLKIDQSIWRNQLHSLNAILSFRDSKVTTAGNALSSKADITQVVNKPTHGMHLDYKFTFLKAATSILNNHFSFSTLQASIGLGRMQYEEDNIFQKNTVDSASLGLVYTIPLEDYDLKVNYQRYFDNFTGEENFNFNEFSIGLGLKW
jgi:hypothetical protein